MGIHRLDAAGVHQLDGSATCFFIGSILGEFQVGLKIGIDLGRQRRESDNTSDFGSLPALDDLSVEMARVDAQDAAGLTIDRIGDQDLPAHGKRFDTAGDIHAAADHRILAALARSNAAHHDLGAIDADAHFQIGRALLAVDGVHPGHGVLHVDGAGNGPQGPVVHGLGGAEKSIHDFGGEIAAEHLFDQVVGSFELFGRSGQQRGEGALFRKVRSSWKRSDDASFSIAFMAVCKARRSSPVTAAPSICCLRRTMALVCVAVMISFG